jgi:DNA-directed RNA polymerase subunit RPC12/RpoP
MTITFSCPTCKARLSINAAAAGRQGKCPYCKRTIVVPRPSKSTVPPATARSKSRIPALLLGVVLGLCVGVGTAAVFIKLGGQSAKWPSTTKKPLTNTDSGSRNGADPSPEPKEPAKLVPASELARKKLREGTDAEKIAAAKELAKFKEEESAYALCEAMTSNNKEVLQAAAEALEQVRPDLYKYAISLAIDHPSELFELVDKVGKMRRSARSLAPLLRVVLQRCLVGETTVSVVVFVKALGAISPDDDETVAMMVKLLASDPNQSLDYLSVARMAAATEVLGEIAEEFPSKRKALLPVLIKALENQMIREQVCKAIGKFGPDGKDAVPALNRYRLDQNERVRQAAVEAMKKIGSY